MDTTDYNMIGPSCYYLYYGVNAMVRKTCCCLDTVYKRVLRLLYSMCALQYTAYVRGGNFSDVDHDFEDPRAPKAHLDTVLTRPARQPGQVL